MGIMRTLVSSFDDVVVTVAATLRIAADVLRSFMFLKESVSIRAKDEPRD